MRYTDISKLKVIGILIALVAIGCGAAYQFITDKKDSESHIVDQIDNDTGILMDNQFNDVDELNIEVVHMEDELAFSFDRNQFMAALDKCYADNRGKRFISDTAVWTAVTCKSTPHSKQKSIGYVFTNDAEVQALPTITLYTQLKDSKVQLITINFDEHSFETSMKEMYDDMCFYALKLIYKEIEDKTLLDISKDIYTKAQKYITDVPYTQGSLPSILYYKDDVGVYPYFQVGSWVRMCIIPVDQELIEYYENKGVEVIKIIS